MQEVEILFKQKTVCEKNLLQYTTPIAYFNDTVEEYNPESREL